MFCNVQRIRNEVDIVWILNRNEEELKKLNDLTNFFIVFAEDEAKERHIMTMQNWIDATDLVWMKCIKDI